MHVREHVGDATHIPVALFISHDDILVAVTRKKVQRRVGERDCGRTNGNVNNAGFKTSMRQTVRKITLSMNVTFVCSQENPAGHL